MLVLARSVGQKGAEEVALSILTLQARQQRRLIINKYDHSSSQTRLGTFTLLCLR